MHYKQKNKIKKVIVINKYKHDLKYILAFMEKEKKDVHTCISYI